MVTELKTVEDVIKTLEIYKNTSTGKNVLVELIDVLAHEVESIKKELVTQRLLIEHEEKLRTNKNPLSHPKYRERRKTEQNIPRKFKRGDVVCRIKDLNKQGQIITVNGDRAKVLFDEKECWVALRSLTYYQVAA